MVIAFSLDGVRARRLGLRILRLEVLRDVNFALAAAYNFIMSALLFTTIVFLPAVAEGPLGYDATIAGLTIVPRGILMIAAMLVVGQMIGKVDYRILLASGWILMAAGLGLLSLIPPVNGAAWIIAGSTLQASAAACCSRRSAPWRSRPCRRAGEPTRRASTACCVSSALPRAPRS